MPDFQPVEIPARDHFSWGRADAAAFGVLLAFIFWTSCALTGCAQAHESALRPQDELERTVADVGLAAWRSAGLATTPATAVLLRLRIERPATAEAYEFACPSDLIGPSWACLGWRQQGDVPVAYMSPMMPVEAIPRQALHEWLHAAGYRFNRWRGTYDSPGHTDTAVWAGSGHMRPNSAEQRAQRALAAEFE